MSIICNNQLFPSMSQDSIQHFLSGWFSWLQSAFPKVHFSEGSLFRRFIVPKVHCSEKRFIVPKVYWSEGSFIRNRGSLLRRFIVPKVHCSEIEVHCSEGSFIRNRGSLLRRLIIPKVQYSEISQNVNLL